MQRVLFCVLGVCCATGSHAADLIRTNANARWQNESIFISSSLPSNPSKPEVIVQYERKMAAPVTSTAGKLLPDKPATASKEAKTLHPPVTPVVTSATKQLSPEIPKPIVKPAPEIKVWKIDKGSSLKKGFELWVSKEKCPIGNGKWLVRWDTDTDYAIDYPLSFSSATFEGATSQLFNLYRKAQAPLYVSGYRHQCLIVISDRK